MKLYLIRHSKSIDDNSGLMQRPDTKTLKGSRSELSITKKYLERIDFSHLYCSPQPRALESAKEMFSPKKIDVLDYIYEYKRPQFLDGAKKEAAIKFWEEDQKENKYLPGWKFDGSESFDDIVIRTRKLLTFLTNNHSDQDKIAIVGHGTFFLHFLGNTLMGNKYAPTVFFDLVRKIDINNGGVLVLDSSNKGWKLTQLFNS